MLITRAKFLRQQLGFSQAQVCGLIDCSRKWLIDFEKGRLDPDTVAHGRVCVLESVLGERVHELVQEMPAADNGSVGGDE